DRAPGTRSRAAGHARDPPRALDRRGREPQRGRPRAPARLARTAAAPRRRERARAAGEPRRPLPLRLPDRGSRVRGPRRPAPRPRARAGAMELTAEALDRVVRTALAEDVGTGDRTTEGVVPAGARCTAELLLEEAGVACGIDAARAVFEALDSQVRFDALVADGTPVTEPPGTLARLEGPARAVLTGERTALNLVGR